MSFCTFKCRKSSCETMQLKNYDVKIFLAQLGWLKHFPASAQLKFGAVRLKRFSAELL